MKTINPETLRRTGVKFSETLKYTLFSASILGIIAQVCDLCFFFLQFATAISIFGL
jgi:hypothetical protein